MSEPETAYAAELAELANGLPVRNHHEEMEALRAQGKIPDARKILAEHPEWWDKKSIVVDLATEEYGLRREAGEILDVDDFCARFPSAKSSLRKYIATYEFFEENPELVTDQPATFPKSSGAYLGFNLLQELGQGTFSRVYLATEPALGDRLVVLKVSRGGRAEAETLGKLAHPQVVPVHSVQQDEMCMTVVCMPYLGTATLDDVLDHLGARRGLPTRGADILQVVQLISHQRDIHAPEDSPHPILKKGSYVEGMYCLAGQIAEALAFIHGRGICHLDLKPSNVLLTPGGKPMLLDFNLSWDEREGSPIPGGTWESMSPEQLLALSPGGQARPAVDARSDLFSLGVIAYQILTGVHPFGPTPTQISARELPQVLLAKIKLGCQPIRKRNPAVDAGLAQVIEKCLAVKPEDRPSSAAAVAAELRKSLSLGRRVRRWLGCHRVVTAALLAVVLVAGAALALAAASRPLQSEFEFQRGWAAYQKGDYSAALQHLNVALNEDPDHVQARYVRGRAYVNLSKFASATEDFQEAFTRVPDGKFQAWLGYAWNCQGQKDSHVSAAVAYQVAEKAGFAPAELYNNLGYSFLNIKSALHVKGSDQTSNLYHARRALDQAIGANPQLQVAYVNRAMVGVAEAHAHPHGGIPYGASNDMEKALALGPVTTGLAYQAAHVFAFTAQREAEVQTVLSFIPGSVGLLGPVQTAGTLNRNLYVDKTRAEQGIAYLQKGLVHVKDSAKLDNTIFAVFNFSPAYQDLKATPAQYAPARQQLFVPPSQDF